MVAAVDEPEPAGGYLGDHGGDEVLRSEVVDQPPVDLLGDLGEVAAGVGAVAEVPYGRGGQADGLQALAAYVADQHPQSAGGVGEGVQVAADDGAGRGGAVAGADRGAADPERGRPQDGALGRGRHSGELAVQGGLPVGGPGRVGSGGGEHGQGQQLVGAGQGVLASGDGHAQDQGGERDHGRARAFESCRRHQWAHQQQPGQADVGAQCQVAGGDGGPRHGREQQQGALSDFAHVLPFPHGRCGCARPGRAPPRVAVTVRIHMRSDRPGARCPGGRTGSTPEAACKRFYPPAGQQEPPGPSYGQINVEPQVTGRPYRRRPAISITVCHQVAFREIVPRGVRRRPREGRATGVREHRFAPGPIHQG